MKKLVNKAHTWASNLITCSTTGLLIAASTLTHAGGTETSREPVKLLFQEGRYLEASFGQAKPDVTDSVYSPKQSIANDISLFSIGYKADLNDKISYAVSQHEPIGADIEYTHPAVALSTQVESTSTGVNGKYQLNDKVSLIAGIKQIRAKASIKILATHIETKADKVIGYTYGAAYEIKDIALRLLLTHNPQIKLSLKSHVGPSAVTNTKGAIPEMTTLNFQSGIAKNTLVFGSIHYAKWGDAQVTIDAVAFGGPLGQPAPLAKGFNTTTYNIGVGQRLNDQWSIAADYSKESGTESVGDSLFSPVDGYQAYGLATEFTAKSFNIGVGISKTKFGSKTLDLVPPFLDSRFSGNDSLNYGIKVGVNL